jgi:hypothetical protein
MSIGRVNKNATEWAIVTRKGIINRFPFDTYDPKGTKSWSEKRGDAYDVAIRAFIRWSDPNCSITDEVKLVER